MVLMTAANDILNNNLNLEIRKRVEVVVNDSESQKIIENMKKL